MDKNEVIDKVKTAGKSAGKKIKGIKFSRADVHSYFERLQSNGKTLWLTVIAAVLVMLFFAFVVFFARVKGPEEVMVPDVEGKQLTQALIEMQKKELYPKITLRYSDTQGDENTILDQSPAAGSIVRGYSRVSLVVSRGAIVDHVENYVGSNYEELKMKLQTLFAGTAKPLIVLAEPQYKPDVSAAGTILAQDPAEGTDISQPVTVHLVVSRGPTFENTRAPKLGNLTVAQMLQKMSQSKLIFDFTSHVAANGEKAAVTDYQKFEDEFIPNYSRVSVEMALPQGAVDGNVYGIFSYDCVEYPYPIPMSLDVTDAEGKTTTLVSFLHNGGSITVPYEAPKESKLTLVIDGREEKSVTIH